MRGGFVCAFLSRLMIVEKSFQAPYGDTSICSGIFIKKKNKKKMMSFKGIVSIFNDVA